MLVAALVVGVVVVEHDDAADRLEVTGERDAFPSRLVAVTPDRRLVVVDAETGREERTLASDFDAEHLSTTPDGDIVFFDYSGALPQDGCTVDDPKLAYVAWTSIDAHGEANTFWTGSLPAVSPDGRLVASATAGPQSCTDNALRIVPTEQALDYMNPEYDIQSPLVIMASDIDALSWSADSRYLALYLSDGAFDGEIAILDVERRTAPKTVPLLDCCDGAAFYGSKELVGTSPRGGKPWYVLYDATTGQLTRLLFESPCSGAASAEVPPPTVSGHSLLIACADALYRWTEGDDAPTRLGGPYRAAAWLPTRQEP
jgi:hypothetical protein